MDNLYRIQAVNPELAKLIMRAKSVYAICGGEVAVTSVGKKDDFAAKKSYLLGQIRQLEQITDARDNSGLAKDSPQYIQLKLQLDSKIHEIEAAMKDTAITLRKELEKHGRELSAEDIRARQDVLEAVREEFFSAYKAAKGGPHAASAEAAGGGVGMSVLSKEQVMKGQFIGAGVKTQKEELTGEQAQKLVMIQQERQKQDLILDEMSKALDELQDLAERMNDELTAQDKQLEDLSNKTDKVQGKLDATNERMKDVLKSVNDKTSNFCVYIICIVLLLGIVTVVYNMATKK